jgi:hypothetical protein
MKWNIKHTVPAEEFTQRLGDGVSRRMRREAFTVQATVELDERALEAMAVRAAKNKGRKCKLGPVVVRISGAPAYIKVERIDTKEER